MRRSIAALFHAVGDKFDLREVEILPSKDQLLVEIELAAICGSELHSVSGKRSTPLPSILGHEAIGRVAVETDWIDFNGQKLERGDRITWSLISTCGECKFCNDFDLPQKCLQLSKYGHEKSIDPDRLNGTFAQHISLIPGTVVFKIPDRIDDRSAVSLNCAFATVIEGLDLISAKRGETAIIFGCGMLGTFAISVLSSIGCREIIAIDINPKRLKFAEKFGATHTVNFQNRSEIEIENLIKKLTENFGVDLVIETSGVAEHLVLAIDLIRLGGRMISLGLVHPNTQLTIIGEKIVRKCLTIHGNHNYRPSSLAKAIDFVEANCERFPFSELVGEIFPLTEIDRAIEFARSGKVMRVGLDPKK